jgi:hypothetical protein
MPSNKEIDYIYIHNEILLLNHLGNIKLCRVLN